MSKYLIQLKKNFSFTAFLLILLVSIAYGAIHGLGPGHGKLIVSSYLLKENAKIFDSFILAVIVAVTHVFSAMIIGIILGLISNLDLIGTQDKARRIAMLISGLIIVGIGITFLISKIRYYIQKLYYSIKKLVTGKEQNFESHSHPHTLEHAHSHDHHGHSHGNTEEIAEKVRKGNISKWQLFLMGITAGMVPCPISMTIIFFGFYYKLVLLSIVSIICISIGIAFTIFVLGILTIKFKGRLLKFAEKKPKFIPRLDLVLGVGSSILIIILGTIIFSTYFAV